MKAGFVVLLLVTFGLLVAYYATPGPGAHHHDRIPPFSCASQRASNGVLGVPMSGVCGATP